VQLRKLSDFILLSKGLPCTKGLKDPNKLGPEHESKEKSRDAGKNRPDGNKLEKPKRTEQVFPELEIAQHPAGASKVS
jgi:hypothetical protein